MRSKLSILGLMYADYELFDQMPDVHESILAFAADRGLKTSWAYIPTNDDIVNGIIAECADLEIMYPSPKHMETLIGMWAKSELHNWQRLFETAAIEFNMIENYDRYEEWTDNSKLNNSQSDSFVTGYDSNKLEPSGRNTSTGDSTGTHKGHLHGNIGVTTNTQMLTEVRTFVENFNLLDVIVDSFKQKFCILIY